MPAIQQDGPPAWAHYGRQLFEKIRTLVAKGADLNGPDGVIYPEIEQVLPTVMDLDISTPEMKARGRQRILRLTATSIEKDA